MVEPNRQCTLCVLFGDWCGRWTGKSYLDGPTIIYDLRSDIICPGILTRKRHFYRCWRPSLGSYRPDIPFSSHSDTKPTQAAKDVIASQDALIDIFERIENFFRRLEEYAEVPTTEAMKDIIVKIMVEVLGLFAIVTKEMKQGLASERMPSAMFPIADRDSEKYLKKLIGRKDIEDALSRLDKLTQEEARMAMAQVLKIAHRVEHGVVQANQRKWLSPPDPSTNQNIASGTQHEGTATWFFQGNIFVQWKSTSTTSLLWIHGKRASLCPFSASHVLTVLNNCSGFREEYPLVCFRLTGSSTTNLRRGLAPQSSKISWRCGRLDWPPWRSSILISGTLINRTSTTLFLPFSHNSLLVPTDVARYSPALINHMTTAHVSPAPAQ